MVLARVVIHVLARVLPHVLARVLLHVLARVIIHVHDYYLKTCPQGAPALALHLKLNSNLHIHRVSLEIRIALEIAVHLHNNEGMATRREIIRWISWELNNWKNSISLRAIHPLCCPENIHPNITYSINMYFNNLLVCASYIYLRRGVKRWQFQMWPKSQDHLRQFSS